MPIWKIKETNHLGYPPLPLNTQIGPVEGIVIEDIDQDGHADVLLTGNSYSTEVASGRYDALLGILLKGHGNGSFSSLTYCESGFMNDYDAGGFSMMRTSQGNTFFPSLLIMMAHSKFLTINLKIKQVK